MGLFCHTGVIRVFSCVQRSVCKQLFLDVLLPSIWSPTILLEPCPNVSKVFFSTFNCQFTGVIFPLFSFRMLCLPPVCPINRLLSAFERKRRNKMGAKSQDLFPSPALPYVSTHLSIHLSVCVDWICSTLLAAGRFASYLLSINPVS